MRHLCERLSPGHLLRLEKKEDALGEFSRGMLALQCLRPGLPQGGGDPAEDPFAHAPLPLVIQSFPREVDEE